MRLKILLAVFALAGTSLLCGHSVTDLVSNVVIIIDNKIARDQLEPAVLDTVNVCHIEGQNLVCPEMVMRGEVFPDPDSSIEVGREGGIIFPSKYLDVGECAPWQRRIYLAWVAYLYGDAYLVIECSSALFGGPGYSIDNLICLECNPNVSPHKSDSV